MPTFARLSCLAALMCVLSVSAHAGDAARGKTLSTTCAACHGADGNSPVPDFPKIGGQIPEYLYRALLDYQQGTREDPIMAGQVANLSKQDMRDLAAFYGSQSGLSLKR